MSDVNYPRIYIIYYCGKEAKKTKYGVYYGILVGHFFHGHARSRDRGAGTGFARCTKTWQHSSGSLGRFTN